MVLIKCPRCQRVTNVQEDNTDFVHNCDSGRDTIDNEDVFDLANKPSWNLAGMANRLSTKARIAGEKFSGVTKRGYRKSSYKQEKHEQYIDLR